MDICVLIFTHTFQFLMNFYPFFFSRKSSSYSYSGVAENLFKLPCKHLNVFRTQFHCFVAQAEIYRRQRMFRLINNLNI